MDQGIDRKQFAGRADVGLHLRRDDGRPALRPDSGLVDAAAAVLGTARTTDTVHAALRDVVARASRERLTRRDYADLTPSALEQLRQVRQLA